MNLQIELPEGEAVEIDYTNWRGVRAVRKVWPLSMWFGDNKYHGGRQWLMGAVDLESSKLRVFALSQIHSWKPGKLQ